MLEFVELSFGYSFLPATSLILLAIFYFLVWSPILTHIPIYKRECIEIGTNIFGKKIVCLKTCFIDSNGLVWSVDVVVIGTFFSPTKILCRALCHIKKDGVIIESSGNYKEIVGKICQRKLGEIACNLKNELLNMLILKLSWK